MGGFRGFYWGIVKLRALAFEGGVCLGREMGSAARRALAKAAFRSAFSIFLFRHNLISLIMFCAIICYIYYMYYPSCGLVVFG